MSKKIPSYSIEEINRCAELVAMDFDIRRLEIHILNPNNLKFPHRHDFYNLIFITEGSGTHDIDFKQYEIQPNQLFFMDDCQVHEWELQNIKGFTLFFKKEFYEVDEKSLLLKTLPFFNNSDSDLPVVVFNENDSQIVQTIFEEILIEFQQKNAHYQQLIKVKLKSLLLYSLRAYKPLYIESSSDLNISKIRSFEKLIEKHFITLKSVKHYADLLNITPNYLNSICNKTTGKSAGEMIRKRIILEAKRLLIHTTLSVCEMAFALGYQDCSYFIRVFKNDTGQTPEQFRIIARS